MAAASYALGVFVACLSVTAGILLDGDADNTTCYHGDSVYPLGSQWTLPGYCRWFICEENNQIVEKGCPDYDLQEGCHMSEYDMAQNYPNCCPQLNCPDPTDFVLQDWVNH